MHSAIRVCLIAARARNNVIGNQGSLPWRLKDDLAFLKRVTMGAPIIMGRKTWESLPVRPLKGRANIVMTRDWTYDAPGARVYSSFGPALAAARAIAVREGAEDVFVIGGHAIYEIALPLTDRLYLTEVDAAPEGDAYFPSINSAEWSEAIIASHPAGERNDHAFTIVRMDRVPAHSK